MYAQQQISAPSSAGAPSSADAWVKLQMQKRACNMCADQTALPSTLVHEQKLGGSQGTEES